MGVEQVVLVLGIFHGLQVTNRNEERLAPGSEPAGWDEDENLDEAGADTEAAGA